MQFEDIRPRTVTYVSGIDRTKMVIRARLERATYGLEGSGALPDQDHSKYHQDTDIPNEYYKSRLKYSRNLKSNYSRPLIIIHTMFWGEFGEKSLAFLFLNCSDFYSRTEDILFADLIQKVNKPLHHYLRETSLNKSKITNQNQRSLVQDLLNVKAGSWHGST